jgi:hypothetical protein
MTETEWLDCTDPLPMIAFLHCQAATQRFRLTSRQLRLLAVAYCRPAFRLLPDARSRQAVDVAERYADGLANSDELWRASELAARAARVGTSKAAGAAALAAGVHPGSASAIARQVAYAVWAAAPRARVEAWDREWQRQADLVRDIFGNPFRRAFPDPAWRTPTVLAIATGAYADRDFSALPILADALEDAGCTAAEVLEHCREPAEHTRGCWVVDWCLGKE